MTLPIFRKPYTLSCCFVLVRRPMATDPAGLAKICIHWRSTLIKKSTRKKLCAAYDDLDHFASIQFHSVVCLHVCGRFLEAFLVAQYNPLVRFDLVCRSNARHSDNWPALRASVGGHFVCSVCAMYHVANIYNNLCIANTFSFWGGEK